MPFYLTTMKQPSSLMKAQFFSFSLWPLPSSLFIFNICYKEREEQGKVFLTDEKYEENFREEMS
jgi:hypothetical protein